MKSDTERAIEFICNKHPEMGRWCNTVLAVVHEIDALDILQARAFGMNMLNSYRSGASFAKWEIKPHLKNISLHASITCTSYHQLINNKQQ